MQLSLKNENKTKSLVTLSVVASLFAFLSVFFSDIILPIPSALFAAVILLESGRKKYFSVSLAAVIIASNLISILFLGGFTFSGVEIVLIGVVISFCFSKNISKAESAFIICAVATFFVLLNAFTLGIAYTQQLSFDAVKEFYSDLYGSVKQEFQAAFLNFAASLPEGVEVSVSAEQFTALLDSMLSLMISLIVICAFWISGVTLKIFSFTVARLSSDKKKIMNWRFRTSNLFAYFYLILIVLQLFTANYTGLFSVLVANLSNIFCVVYAYVGFNFALSLLSAKRSVAFSFIMLLIGLALFSSIMIEILAIMGAFVTISGNKATSKT